MKNLFYASDINILMLKMEKAGFSISAQGSNLRVEGGKLSDSQRQHLKQHKTEILRYLVHLESANQSNYTLWFYQIDNQDDYTRMGLMTADCQQAQKQLEAIYDKSIKRLQRRQ